MSPGIGIQYVQIKQTITRESVCVSVCLCLYLCLFVVVLVAMRTCQPHSFTQHLFLFFLQSFKLLLRNVLRVAVSQGVGGFVLFLMRLLIVAGAGLMTVLYLRVRKKREKKREKKRDKMKLRQTQEKKT